MTDTRVKDDVSAVIEAHPDLSSYGWRFPSRSGWNDGERFEHYRAETATEDFRRQVATCRAYIRAKRIGKCSSYALKHSVEHWVRDRGHPQYITNGAAIVAALMLDYSPVREMNSPNCWFTFKPNK